jgi:mono/diheme cytochrome c family protein
VALAIAALLAGLALPALRFYWWRREANPVRRGAALAARVGCLSCHGPHGTQGLPDPNTSETVPPWDGGVPMMFVSGEEEVREYILDGVSKRRAASPVATAERLKAAIRMPAYRGMLKTRDVEDLVAYFMAVSALRPVSDPTASRGRELVRRHRCEACHGIGGSGGVRNPGSLKGYVPGWLGADYADLVRDDGELKEWILEGGIGRFAADRFARYFVNRQRLQMPAYRQALSTDDADAIGAYIRWLREES